MNINFIPSNKKMYLRFFTFLDSQKDSLLAIKDKSFLYS